MDLPRAAFLDCQETRYDSLLFGQAAKHVIARW